MKLSLKTFNLLGLLVTILFFPHAAAATRTVKKVKQKTSR